MKLQDDATKHPVNPAISGPPDRDNHRPIDLPSDVDNNLHDRPRFWLFRSIVAADKPDKLTLNFYAVRSENTRFIGGIGSLQCDGCPLAPEAFQRGLFIIDKRNDDFSGLAVLPLRMMTVSPSKIPASIIESP